MRWGLVAVVVLLATAVQADPPRTFSAAKRLMREVYADHRETFYCDCSYDERGQVDPDSCGFVPQRESVRSWRIEWEHVVPASRMVEAFGCRSRKACHAIGAFRRMEAEPMNLVPAVGELNAARRNYPLGEIEGEPRRWGACDFEVEDRVAEPREEIRGDVARIHLWMEREHGLELDDDEWWQMVEWSSADPPDDWERERRRRIEEAKR